jgi:hypothetical protein
MKSWEVIADNLSQAGWSWDCGSAVDCEGRTLWIVDAHRDDGRLVVRADEKLTAFIGTAISDSRGQLSNLASYEIGLSNSICAVRQPSRAKRN